MIRRRIVWVLFCSAIAWTVFAGSPSVGAAQAKPAMKPASAAAPSKAEATVRPLHLNIQPHQLANGLHVLMVEDRSAPVINLQVWYHVGSKDEKPGRTGFAHIFEHMMFKGSSHVGPD